MSDLLARVSRVKPTTAFLGALVLVLLGLFVPGVVGGVLLLVLALLVGALTVGTWQRRAGVLRPLRVGVLLLLLVVALMKIS